MPDEPCILCPAGRDRDPEPGSRVDVACRAGVHRLIADVRILAEQLDAPDDLVPDRRLITAALPRMPRGPRPPGVSPARWAALDKRLPVRVGAPRDPVAAGLPSGAVGARLGPPASGGDVEARMPIAVNRVDLTLRTGSRDAYVRGLLGLDDDQVGHLPLATWVRDQVREWAAPRRESPGPLPLGKMLRWLAARADWACDELDAGELVAFVADLRGYRATMRGVLGLIESDEVKIGVSCPGCHNQSLYRENGKWYIECYECPKVMKPSEYLERVHRNVVCLACVDRMLTYRAARSGWRWRERLVCYRPVGYGANWPNG